MKLSVLVRIHRYLGLFLCLHLLVTILTGSVLVFRHELTGQQTDTHQIYPLSPTHIQSIVTAGQSKFTDGRPLAIFKDDHNPNLISFRLGRDQSRMFSGAHRFYFDLSTESELYPSAPNSSPSSMDIILDLHRNFLLGGWGEYYLAFIGFLYAIVLIIGFMIYGPYSKRQRFAELRAVPGKPKVYWLDLHRFIGISIFAWSFIIALSGVCLAVGDQLIKIYQVTELAELEASYPLIKKDQSLPDIGGAEAYRIATETIPGELSFLAFPETQFSIKGHYLILIAASESWIQDDLKLVLVQRKTGTIDAIRSLPWFLRLLLVAEPLHFGNYAGLPLKIIWVLCGLISLVPILTGIFLFTIRNLALPKRVRSLRIGWRGIGKAGPQALRIPWFILLVVLTGIVISFYSSSRLKLLGSFLVISPFLCLLFSFIRSVQKRRPYENSN